MTDQHHADCLGVVGVRSVRTPALDRLAARGVRFERAYCNSPICAPSRACFHTGQYLHGHRLGCNHVREFGGAVPPTLPGHFQQGGYQTAIIGKAHLPASWLEEGYEHRRYCDLSDATADDPRSAHYFDYLCRHNLADAYDLGALLPPHPGSFYQAFVSEIPYEHCVERWTGREALQFLATRDKSRPFFLHLSFQRPHEPYCVPFDYAREYAPEAISLPASAVDYFERQFAGKPDAMRSYIAGPKGRGYPYRAENDLDLKRNVSCYYELVTMIDREIGILLDWLDHNGLTENTIIAFVADHGDFAGDHGLSDKNLGLYESIHRIPFLLSWPGGPRGRVERGLVESVDLFPTLCGLAGLAQPVGVPGVSLVGSEWQGRTMALCEWDQFSEGCRMGTIAVRTARHRLVFYCAHPGDGELYDVVEDPGELVNHYCDQRWSEVRADLTALALASVNQYTRACPPDSDRKYLRSGSSPTFQLHKRGVKWSELGQSDIAARAGS